MATVDVDIVNYALVKMDVRVLESFTESTKAAQFARVSYEHLRDDVLASAPWNFAMKRALIPQSTEELPWADQSQTMYALPGDCLRVWRVYRQRRWNVEGRFLVLGSSLGDDNQRTAVEVPDALPILYIKRAEAVQDYSPSFREALAARLVIEWAEGLTGSTSKIESFQKLYALKLEGAKAIDGQEGVPEDLFVDSWTDARGD